MLDLQDYQTEQIQFIYQDEIINNYDTHIITYQLSKYKD